MVNNLVRAEVPNRMHCFNLRMIVDTRTVNTSVDYAVTPTGVNPMALWVKLKPNESTLDREPEKIPNLNTDPYRIK